MLRSALTALAIAVCFTSTVALSGEADVKKVTARKDGSNSYTFHVTVGHKDTGWDHHADKWDVVGLTGACWTPVNSCIRTSMNSHLPAR